MPETDNAQLKLDLAALQQQLTEIASDLTALNSVNACTAPPAVASLLARTASKPVPRAVIAAFMIRLAFSGFQSSAQSSCSTLISPRAINGTST